MYCSSLLFLSCALGANAQTLFEAISKIPQLSNFTAFYSANKAFANAIYANKTLYPITVLIPDDNAFAAYQQKTGHSLADAPPQTLLTLTQYHTLVSNLSKDNFTSSGTTVPTLMTNEQYNNRSVGTALADKFGGPEKTKGQVVFIKSTGSSSKFLLSRQQQGGSGTDSIRSGLSDTTEMTALESEGIWEGGRFHIVDGLLTPPDLCSTTIRSASMTSLDDALNKTNLWGALDSTANVTCLGPSNDAFKQAGNPQQSLATEDLKGALLFHTLPMVAYSDYLVDGMEFTSLQNITVRVKVQDNGNGKDIWFNNAKLIDANVLTHNGLVHVLDAVMKPLDQINATASPTPSSTASATGGASKTASSSAGPAKSSGAAVVGRRLDERWAFLSFLGVAVLAI